MIPTKRNFKGFVFTLDAIFALIVAVASVSILMYVHFSSTLLYTAPAAEASSILQNLLQTSVYSASQGNAYASYLLNGWNGNAYSWPQFGHDPYHSSNTSYGPQSAYLLYTFTAANTILPTVAVDQGIVAFAAGQYLYAINATTGIPLNTYPLINVGAVQVSPVIYENEIIYTCPTGCIMAESISNSLLQVWSQHISKDVSTPLQIENGYLAFGAGNTIYLLYPENGTIASSVSLPTSNPAQPPAYINGEYIVSTTSPNSQNYVYAYVLTGGTLTNVWSYTLKTSQTTPPVVNGSAIAVGSGSALYLLTPGGTLIKQNQLPNAQIVGVASTPNNFYVQTVNAIYRFSLSSNTLFSYPTLANNQNSIPSISYPILYTLVSGTNFEGYNLQTGTNAWNITLPSSSMYNGFSEVALAYGNAYVANGNKLYVFGNYDAQPGDSLLQTLASMYMNNQSAYSNIMLSTIYNSTNVGIFLNGAYAASSKIPKLDGQTSYIDTGPAVMPLTQNSITWSAWVYRTGPDLNCYDGILGHDNIQMDEPGTCTGTSYNSVYCTVRISSGGYYGTSASNLDYNKWYFVLCSYNLASNSLQFWLNNNLINTATIVNSLYYEPSTHFVIGSQGGPNPNYNGLITNVQLYNIALTPPQIAQLYQGGQFGMPVNYTSLIGWWPLDGDYNDYSGHSNIGIPTNVLYTSSNVIPASLKNAFQISEASAPISITSNGVNKLYNVSVVSWR